MHWAKMSYQKELRETEFTQIGPRSSEQYSFQNVHLLFKHPVGSSKYIKNVSDASNGCVTDEF